MQNLALIALFTPLASALILGIFLILLIATINTNWKKTLRNWGIVLIAFIIILILLKSLPIFNGFVNRMTELINLVVGKGKIDLGDSLRKSMIEVGSTQFMKTPLFGIGFRCTYILAGFVNMKWAYLHNNFLELLVCGGIIAFLLYYSMYIYIIYWLVKDCKSTKNKDSLFCVTFVICLLFNDLAAVSYEYMITYFLFIILFKYVETIKKSNQDIQKGETNLFNKILEKFKIKFMSTDKYIDYLRHKDIKIGNGCEIYKDVVFGSEPYLIEIGDNVRITNGVKFITHDGGVWTLRNLYQNQNIDLFGKIKIGNNVHIGFDTIIMPGVTIGDNCIIGCGAVVTKSIPSNQIWAGVPARYIKSIDEYYLNHQNDFDYTKNMSSAMKKEYLLDKFK